MKSLCLFLIFAVLSNEALGMSYRHRRQSEDETEDKDNLEDRYGWNRPNFNQGQWGFNPNPRPWRPNPFPGLLPDPTPFPPQDTRPTRPTQNPQEQTPVPPTPTTNTNQNGNADALRNCLRNCPTTSEYNPVCGTNNVTYDNPGRLICAQSCGVNVSTLRSSRCPAPTPAPS